MAFIPTPNVVKVDLTYNWNGQICQNVLHYDAGEAIIGDDLAPLAAALVAKMTGSYWTIVSDQCSLYEMTLTLQDSVSSAALVTSVGLPKVGTNASPSMPNNVSLCITKRTAKRGRSYRGRLYHVGLCENSVTGNNVATAHATIIKDYWATWLSVSFAPKNANMVVLSYQNNGLPRLEGEPTWIQGFTTDEVVDSQRRRLPGRGG